MISHLTPVLSPEWERKQRYFSVQHGYEMREYQIQTSDHYLLTLHRLIHPTDAKARAPMPGTKKPYILVHGLLGSSASYVRNVAAEYQAPGETFDASKLLDELMASKSKMDFGRDWVSTADLYHAAFEGDISADLHESTNFVQKLLDAKSSKEFALLNDIDYIDDPYNFGKDFKRFYRVFDLPQRAKPFISNSLAFTLSNFGYDVWLINLRGNAYSRGHAGSLHMDLAEYWDFNMETLIREDLPAAINYVRTTSRWGPSEPMGLVGYSYTSMNILAMLTKMPSYQETLQPLVLMAPNILTSAARDTKYRVVMQLGTKAFFSHNGPFPSIKHAAGDDSVLRLLCKLPVANELCLFFEKMLFGKVKNVQSALFDKQGKMIKSDARCGTTSKAVLHEMIENLSSERIHPKYKPFESARVNSFKGRRNRRSVMLIHSESDDMANMKEVRRIRDSALKTMSLVDLVIKEPQFEHTDFLFSHRNQYLVNGEIARMVSVFDYMVAPISDQAGGAQQSPPSARQSQVPG